MKRFLQTALLMVGYISSLYINSGFVFAGQQGRWADYPEFQASHYRDDLAFAYGRSSSCGHVSPIPHS